MSTDGSNTDAATDSIELSDLFTITALVGASNGTLNETNLRWQLRNRGETGLDACVVRSGKKLLISKSRYERWLATRIERTIRAGGTTASQVRLG